MFTIKFHKFPELFHNRKVRIVRMEQPWVAVNLSPLFTLHRVVCYSLIGSDFRRLKALYREEFPRYGLSMRKSANSSMSFVWLHIAIYCRCTTKAGSRCRFPTLPRCMVKGYFTKYSDIKIQAQVRIIIVSTSASLRVAQKVSYYQTIKKLCYITLKFSN